jgi:hypothetical protein
MQKFLVILFFLCFAVNAELVFVDGVEFQSLAEAKTSIKDGSHVYLKAGIYTQGIEIKANNVSIVGEKNVIFDDAAVAGKAALVLSGNNVTLESIECQNIQVPDMNGACIRFEGQNLTIKDLYVHDSQSGVMTSHTSGFLHIKYSRFERLGSKAMGRGYAHAIYAIVDELVFSNSQIFSIGNEGSGIKSRSKKTVIVNSVLASLDACDSRLVDIANFGELIIKHSILQQGEHSSNSQVLAYGLEPVNKTFAINRIEIIDNLFLLDRHKANVIIAHKQADEVLIENNTMIGDYLYPDEFSLRNSWYLSRAKAKMQPYPYLPEVSDLEQLLVAISIVGERN